MSQLLQTFQASSSIPIAPWITVNFLILVLVVVGGRGKSSQIGKKFLIVFWPYLWFCIIRTSENHPGSCLGALNMFTRNQLKAVDWGSFFFLHLSNFMSPALYIFHWLFFSHLSFYDQLSLIPKEQAVCSHHLVFPSCNLGGHFWVFWAIYHLCIQPVKWIAFYLLFWLWAKRPTWKRLVFPQLVSFHNLTGGLILNLRRYSALSPLHRAGYPY